MIVGSDICKCFGDKMVLDKASFHVEKGSVYGLVGPNGSGKSTLIRHIMGIFKPDSGCVYVDKEPVYENVEIKSKIAYVPDEIYYTGAMTILDMADLYAGMYRSFDPVRLDKLIDAFSELEKNLQFRRMSKGMLKQAAVILAMCIRAEVIVLDEPMDGLDPYARHRVWQLILDSVAAEGTTVLVSSHNLRELEDVCDHVGIIDHGRIVKEGSYDELMASGEMTLEDVFIKEVGGADDGFSDIFS
ncbi:MAG: ABC transporter ATP-binding protein [Eubacterium sp.]|nr:ABC transporter ATP-binding protein [Eubacterium sp.]